MLFRFSYPSTSFEESAKYFNSPLQQFQFFDKYSRFNYDLGRRETWVETVSRAVEYLREISQNKLKEEDYQRIHQFILEMKSLPSMRLLAMAGEAARRNNVAIYNCSYMPVDSLDAFVEALIISMNGCGVGFSVEKRYVEQLPEIKPAKDTPPEHFIIPDTTEGWAEALRKGLKRWFEGEDVTYDYSLIRPAGAPLRVKGGRASGPEPLRLMLDFARQMIRSRQGKKLSTLDCLDLMCVVGNAAVSGGTRRTAMIALADFDDQDIRLAKSGDFEKEHWYRWNANISLVWPNRPLTKQEIADYMQTMHASCRGEPGIFSRRSAELNKPSGRKSADWGTNPCGEIILRPFEFCNLSIAVLRPEDTLSDLKEKVRVATMIGTIQSMATHFPGLREIWRKNCEEERLLGVDITGLRDCQAAHSAEALQELREMAIKTNREYAEILGINPAASATCVKPSGNSSVLLGVSPGIHAHWSRYYIRRVRIDHKNPLRLLLQDQGVRMNPENGQTVSNATTWVISFPVKSPDGAITRENYSAMEQLEFWLLVKRNWATHNPSATITYQPEELPEMIDWLFKNQDYIGGLTFLPRSDAKYDQMPYEAINQQQYEEMQAEFPDIDFSALPYYEQQDMTNAAQELACVSGACDL